MPVFAPSAFARSPRAVLLQLLLAASALPALLPAQVAPTVVPVPMVVAPAERPATSFVTDFGYVATSGNTRVSTVNVAERLVHTRGFWRVEQTIGIVYGEVDGNENANLLRAGLGAEYAVRPWLALATGALYDRNRFAGIARRTEEYLGLVFRVLQAPRDTLRLETGASLTQQTGVDGGTNRFPAARAAAWYKRTLSPNAFFLHTVEAIPNLEAPEDYRVNSESALVAPLSRRMALKLGYVVRFDNVPEVGFLSTDRIFTTGLQLSF
jgi:putative salt-induced outer membrane protein